eukprot:2164598-Amphidinium_carterae.1
MSSAAASDESLIVIIIDQTSASNLISRPIQHEQGTACQLVIDDTLRHADMFDHLACKTILSRRPPGPHMRASGARSNSRDSIMYRPLSRPWQRCSSYYRV